MATLLVPTPGATRIFYETHGRRPPSLGFNERPTPEFRAWHAARREAWAADLDIPDEWLGAVSFKAMALRQAAGFLPVPTEPRHLDSGYLSQWDTLGVSSFEPVDRYAHGHTRSLDAA